MKTESLVVSIPAHNESRFLENAVRTVLASGEGVASDFVVAIAEDGSTDGTYEIAKKMAWLDPRVRIFHSSSKLGRGRALTTAWSQLTSGIYLFLDADLSTDMRHFSELVEKVREGYDVVTGSRYAVGATVTRPILRLVVSKAYNSIIRLLFRDGIYDHQCGFKAFSQKAIRELLPLSRSKHWFWDTEMLVLASMKGLRIAEIPVRWNEKRLSRTGIRRLVRDVVTHGAGTVKLVRRLRKMKAEYQN